MMIGFMLNILLYGVMITQAYTYFRTYPKYVGMITVRGTR